MKKLLIIILSFWSLQAYAQYTYANQWAIEVSGGWNSGKGLSANLGVNTVLGLSASSIHLELGYDQATFNVAQYRLKSHVGALNVLYGYSLDRAIKSNLVHINFLIGANLGYESIPQAPDNGIVINHDSGLIYGLSLSTQIEFKFSKSIGIYLEPRYNYLIKTDLNHSRFRGLIGLRYYIK